MILREMLPGDKTHIASHLCRLWQDAQKDFKKGMWEMVDMKDTKFSFAVDWKDGSPAAIVGVEEMPGDPPGTGFVWLVASDVLDKKPLAFLRHTRNLIPELFDQTPYQRFRTFVSIPYTTNLNYSCRWNGMEIVQTLPPAEGGKWARFELAVRRNSPGPKEMMNITVKLNGSLVDRFPGHKDGSIVIVLRRKAAVADALKILSLAETDCGMIKLEGKKASLDTVLSPDQRLEISSPKEH